jgi:hypothetical protein
MQIRVHVNVLIEYLDMHFPVMCLNRPLPSLSMTCMLCYRSVWTNRHMNACIYECAYARIYTAKSRGYAVCDNKLSKKLLPKFTFFCFNGHHRLLWMTEIYFRLHFLQFEIKRQLPFEKKIPYMYDHFGNPKFIFRTKHHFYF